MHVTLWNCWTLSVKGKARMLRLSVCVGGGQRVEEMRKGPPFRGSGMQAVETAVAKLHGEVMNMFLSAGLGARLRGRTTPHTSKKCSEKVLGRGLGKGSQKGS